MVHWLQQSRACVPNQLDCWSGFEFAERQAQGHITGTIAMVLQNKDMLLMVCLCINVVQFPKTLSESTQLGARKRTQPLAYNS